MSPEKQHYRDTKRAALLRELTMTEARLEEWQSIPSTLRKELEQDAAWLRKELYELDTAPEGKGEWKRGRAV